MDPDQIIKTLPPVILGFGGIVPALVVSSGSIFANASKALLCTIMILVVWIGYWAAIMYWELFLFDDRITLALLIFTVVLLIWVFLGALPRESAVVHPDPRPENSPRRKKKWKLVIRKLLIPSETPRAIYLIVYIVALTSVSIAAALYVGPKGQVILTLEGPPQVTAVEVIWHRRPNPLPVSHKKERRGAKVVLTEAEFADARRFVMRTKSDALWIAERSAARAVVSPGLAERYVVNAEQSY